MPGSTVLTVGNEDLTLNLFDRVKEMRSMKDHPYLLADDMMSNVDTAEGGDRFIIPWETDDHSVPTRIRTGYEKLNQIARTTVTPGYQGWGIVAQPVFISDVDVQKNSSRAALFNLQDLRVNNVERHMLRQLQTGALRGFLPAGTGHPGVPGFDDFLSLNGGDTVLGLIEDSATGTNTLHNVSKINFPPTTHEKFHNAFFDCGGDASLNALPALYSSVIDQQVREGEVASANESYWYWTRAFAGHIKNALRTQEYYTQDGTLDDGKRVAHAVYAGVKVRVIAEMPNTLGAPSGGIPGPAGAKPWSAVRINWKRGIRFRGMPGYLMDWSKFIDLPGGLPGLKYAVVKLWGNLVGQELGLCTLIVDAEAF